MRRKRRTWTLAEKASIVKSFKKSGLVQQDFAKKNGIHVSSLARWLHQDRGGQLSAKNPRLVPVNVSHHIIDPQANFRFEVLLRNGRVLRVRDGFDEGALARLVEVLEKC